MKKLVINLIEIVCKQKNISNFERFSNLKEWLS